MGKHIGYHVCGFFLYMPAVQANQTPVHGEPGEDKRIYANDVADWVLSKANSGIAQDNGENKSKL